MSVLSKKSSVAPAGYNRWLIPPAALCVHLSIGQVYALSVFKIPLEHHFNASHTQIGWIFSLAIGMLGISSALFGRWVERNGPRKAMVVAAACWVSGFLIGALGIATGQLWLLYLGYGFLGGIGLGIGYISPVSTLMKWFPEKPGLATGMAIMGFGGGALVAAPFATALMDAYNGGGTEISGSALVSTFVTMGLTYAVLMAIGAALIRIPPGFEDDETSEHFPGQGGALVRTNRAVRTPQFYLLWIVLFTNVTAGIGILENAGPMIQDFFRVDGTSPVTAAMAAGFVGLLSLANMGGRFGWSTLSDKIGRKPAYFIYLGVGLALYLVLAQAGSSSVALMVTLAFIIITFYGGGFATIPAYLKDLFGTLEVGAIHGRLLTAWSAAGIAGPLIVNSTLDRAGEPGTLVAADYRPALLIMVGVLGVGFIANLLVRKVDAKHFDADQISRLRQRTIASENVEIERGIRRLDVQAVTGRARWIAVVPWLIAGVPLALGLYQTVLKAVQLFTA